MKSNWNLKQIARFMSYLTNMGWDMCVISEGVLGFGHRLFTKEGHKTVEIKEYYLNEWSSGHMVSTLVPRLPYEVSEIAWESDGVNYLPYSTVVHVPIGLTDLEKTDYISEQLSCSFGYCHSGFSWRPKP